MQTDFSQVKLCLPACSEQREAVPADSPVARGGFGIFPDFPVLLQWPSPACVLPLTLLSLGEIRVQQGQPPRQDLPGFSSTKTTFGERFPSPQLQLCCFPL